MLELEPYLGRYSAQLSGGQRQRVAVARAVVMEPSVLLMDEPLSNLDALLRLQFRAELKRLVHDLHTTTIYVTHDQVEALSLGDRVAVMREGEILQIDEPMVVYDRPASEFVGSFIGNPPMNFLRGILRQQEDRLEVMIGTQALSLPLALAPSFDGSVVLGIRAEHINIRTALPPESDELAAEISVVEPLGSHSLVTAIVEGQAVKVATRTDFMGQPGERIELFLEAEKIRWFPQFETK
jgi:multiple sugar transport system ATP-binding protein